MLSLYIDTDFDAHQQCLRTEFLLLLPPICSCRSILINFIVLHFCVTRHVRVCVAYECVRVFMIKGGEDV